MTQNTATESRRVAAKPITVLSKLKSSLAGMIARHHARIIALRVYDRSRD